MEKILKEKIKPSPSAFSDAHVLFLVFQPNNRMPPILVHGLCKDENGELFPYAWVLRGDRAYYSGHVKDAKGDYVLRAFDTPIDIFKSRFEVVEVTEYDTSDLNRLATVGNPHGPWEDKYMLKNEAKND